VIGSRLEKKNTVPKKVEQKRMNVGVPANAVFSCKMSDVCGSDASRRGYPTAEIWAPEGQTRHAWGAHTQTGHGVWHMHYGSRVILGIYWALMGIVWASSGHLLAILWARPLG
jgi:hypothetical protein